MEFVPYLQRLFIKNKVSVFKEEKEQENRHKEQNRQLHINFSDVQSDELGMKGSELIWITTLNNVERVTPSTSSIEEVIDQEFFTLFEL